MTPEEEKMWYVILNDEIHFALGKKREQGYWWFPKVSYSVPESHMFESNLQAEKELLSMWMIRKANLTLKIKALTKKLEENHSE